MRPASRGRRTHRARRRRRRGRASTPRASIAATVAEDLERRADHLALHRGRRRATRGRVVVAEPAAWRRRDRDRLPQRRDRAARATPRRGHTGQRDAATARQRARRDRRPPGSYTEAEVFERIVVEAARTSAAASSNGLGPAGHTVPGGGSAPLLRGVRRDRHDRRDHQNRLCRGSLSAAAAVVIAAGSATGAARPARSIVTAHRRLDDWAVNRRAVDVVEHFREASLVRPS